MALPYGGRFTPGSVMERKGTRLLKIGEIARLVGLGVGTVRNYEQRSLLKPEARSEADQHRLYGQEQVAWLRLIRQANLARIPLTEIKELLALIAEGDRGEDVPRVKEVLEEKLRETEQKMKKLSAFREGILHYR
ncbi:MAG: MerR family transcriptional regulator [Actinomycetota bacterium]|nr:MerR family transcriptional regulator [Actinomycetota bacterium]